MKGHRGTYPADWPAIAEEIKRQAGYCCEHCQAPHDPATGHTLTVHHLDFDKSNCSPSNLVALCQKCHLSLQGKYLPGQQFLPGFTPTWVIERELP